MSQVIEEARDLLQGRLDDLNGEAKKLERALAGLADTNGRPARRPGRPKKAVSPVDKAAALRRSAGAAAKTIRKPRKAKAARRKREGGRADQAVALITAEPGISASVVAKKMKIKPNYLYRVLGELEKEGRVRKEGRTYFPV